MVRVVETKAKERLVLGISGASGVI